MTSTPSLAAKHYTMLAQDSGIDDDVITERGYRTCTGYSELKSLGIILGRNTDANGLLLPLWGVDGIPATHLLVKEDRHVPYTVFRPDIPMISHDGRERKYLNPKSARIRLDSHPRCHDALQDLTRFLWVTEGIKNNGPAKS